MLTSLSLTSVSVPALLDNFSNCFRLSMASSQAKGPSVCYQNWRKSTTSLRVKTTQSSLWTTSCLLQTATSFPACSTYGLQARSVTIALCCWDCACLAKKKKWGGGGGQAGTCSEKLYDEMPSAFSFPPFFFLRPVGRTALSQVHAIF